MEARSGVCSVIYVYYVIVIGNRWIRFLLRHKRTNKINVLFTTTTYALMTLLTVRNFVEFDWSGRTTLWHSLQYATLEIPGMRDYCFSEIS